MGKFQDFCVIISARSGLRPPPPQCDVQTNLVLQIQFVDGQYALYHDLTPIFPTELLRVQLPCPESLWRAPSATTWRNILKQNGKFAEPEPEPEPEPEVA